MNDDLLLEEVMKLEGNPVVNPLAILIVKQSDGNYRGFLNRQGKIIQARQYDPYIVLMMLITHP